MVDLETLFHYLDGMPTDKERLEYLGDHYPAMCIFVMKKRGWERQLEEYTKKCYSYEDDCENYSLYVHGYWLPLLQ